MKISINYSSIICPAVLQEAPNKQIWLSNIDLLLGGGHTPILYLYKPNGPFSSNFFDVKVLKEALKQVLVLYYPVAGRLRKHDNGKTEINCNGEGVLFIEAQANSAMVDINDFTPSQQLWQLIPVVEYSNGISSYPLLLLQVTKFACGGVSLGIGWHHILADGVGFTNFMIAWGNIVRGLPIGIPPSFDRTILSHRVPPTPTIHHHEYGSPPTLNSSSITTHNPQYQSASKSNNSLKILKITPAQIKILKVAISKYTTFEILTGHIWRCVSEARGLPSKQATMVYISVEGRSRLCPPAPRGYFGNAVFHTTTTALAGELISEPLVKTVKRIHEAIKRVDDEYIRSAIDNLEEQMIWDNPPSVMKDPQSTCRSPSLKIVSWLSMPFYDAADFGWGRPVYMRATNPWEGKGHIVSSPNKDGSLLLLICLETHHIPSFEKLFYGLISDKIGLIGNSRI
ncbi:hypothetical protein P3X46_031745 [Hevea brasiliensis]|uniref:Uncharacterized protein n=1 Tax=Hevea brasiliensis TaxID=3981 RepID=A0ABQ9KLC6_HEVBR|nr:shikimate O-hydroxycinnamoyltransferase [Hevea brasiliensis]XP_057995135.1 shikimate O-hydroxycinnamoyltransferase [Hevea brasiliensis]KAJ9141176.1 hypothetical protein P3X46_031745 [Hevea brasiliensis]